MKTAEVGQRVLTGAIVLVGEFRDWEAKLVGVNGKSNVIETCFVIHGRNTIEVQNWRERGATVQSCIRPAFKAGERVACTISSLEHSRFGTRAKGTVERLEVA